MRLALSRRNPGWGSFERRWLEHDGEGDAKATTIYAKAYGRDPGFYEFWKSMETLQTALDKDATVILSTDSELLKYLKDSKGR